MPSMSSGITPPTPAAIARAVERLRAGELVAFPTETVYGLGADADNQDAVRAIFAAKGRPADHPVIVHLADDSQLAHWAREIPADAQRLADAFWPGPLTLILPRAARVSDAVTGGQDRVGLRRPSHPVARALLDAFAAAGGNGVAAPSANRFGRISPTTAQHVSDDLGTKRRADSRRRRVRRRHREHDRRVRRRRADAAAARRRARGRNRARARSDAARTRCPCAARVGNARRRTTRRARRPGFCRASALARACADSAGPVAVLARTLARPAQFAGGWIDAPREASALRA